MDRDGLVFGIVGAIVGKDYQRRGGLNLGALTSGFVRRFGMAVFFFVVFAERFAAIAGIV